MFEMFLGELVEVKQEADRNGENCKKYKFHD